jgi:beta-N-acetylhexosaminidase
MVGVPATGTSPTVLRQLAERHVGNVMLTGRSSLGVEATARVVEAVGAGLSSRARSGIPLVVATDQEGGAVQVLSGPGFDDIPSALQQGGWSVGRLRSESRDWGRQLRAAGVTMNLAPVADIVPSSPDPKGNGPIGYFDRQFGASAPLVRRQARAFSCGMADAGVVAAVKHFPGLGHVKQNTDNAAAVVDDTVGRRDRGLAVFTAVARACRSAVMTSTAFYDRLDPAWPASFSSIVVRSLLRERLGFDGVVVSDDLGRARQVARWTPGERARLFLAAGGDLVLSVEPADAAPMAATITAAARRDPGMRARVRESTLRVLTLKSRLRLLDG